MGKFFNEVSSYKEVELILVNKYKIGRLLLKVIPWKKEPYSNDTIALYDGVVIGFVWGLVSAYLLLKIAELSGMFKG